MGMDELRQVFLQRLSYGKELYLWGWRWVALVVWVIPYGVLGVYDLLLGQEFLPKSWPTLSQLLPNWLPTLWFILGILAILLVTFEGSYRINKKIVHSRKLHSEIQSLIKDGAGILEQVKNHSKFGDTWPTQEFKDWREKVRIMLVKYSRSDEESLWYKDVGVIDVEQAQHFSGRVSEACIKGLELLENMLKL
jgi:hypothetical protein